MTKINHSSTVIFSCLYQNLFLNKFAKIFPSDNVILESFNLQTDLFMNMFNIILISFFATFVGTFHWLLEKTLQYRNGVIKKTRSWPLATSTLIVLLMIALVFNITAVVIRDFGRGYTWFFALLAIFFISITIFLSFVGMIEGGKRYLEHHASDW